MSANSSQEQSLDHRENYAYDKDHSKHFVARSSQSHAAFFTPYLHSGMTLVDCGCGPGTVTVGLAEQVAPGSVLGIDINQSALAKACELATARSLTNIRFEQASIYAIPCADASVDAIFIHAVLHHLNEPANALREALRIVKPGGVLGVREPDMGGHIFGPTEGPMRELYDLWAQMIQRNGGNPYLGRALRSLLHQAGCRDVIATASYESHGTPESIAVFRSGGAGALGPDGALGRGLLNANLIDEPQLAALRVQVEAWVDDPVCFIARPWCEAVGWKS